MRMAQGDQQALEEGMHISQANMEFTARYNISA